MDHRICDVLVIGSGAAGLRAAAAAKQAGARVLVVSRGAPGKASATIVRGGAFAGSRDGESTAGHLERTLQAGRGLNQRSLAEVLAEKAPVRLKELVGWGITGGSTTTPAKTFMRSTVSPSGRPPRRPAIGCRRPSSRRFTGRAETSGWI